MKVTGHVGDAILAAARAFGVEEVFTLSGAHIFPLYDGCQKAGVRLLDVRHEQTAAFAAEAMAKLTRRPGLVGLTAGPGVTNGMSAIATAMFNGSPVLVVGGRAAEGRWGSGSLQEIDHLPFVAPLVKQAHTIRSAGDAAADVTRAIEAALTPHRGPVFVDVPIDVVFGPADAEVAEPGGAPLPQGAEPDPDLVDRAASLLAGAERPAIVAGSDVYWEGAWDALRRCAEGLRIPVFVNGLGRGCIPADHELAFSRTRGLLKEADVVAVVGTPLDFRVSFGQFGDAAVVHATDGPGARGGLVQPAVAVEGSLAAVLDGWAAWSGPGRRGDHADWIRRLSDEETARRAGEEAELSGAGTSGGSGPIHPARVYGELRRVLDRDAVVVCDGGDFVSYAGKYIESYQPGCWLDTGPFGCLGTGPGYAMAARVARPDRQVVALLGDGAFGFSGIDWESLARQDLPVVGIVGNNGIWGLEYHPMRSIYGYQVAAELQPELRYDEVVKALGGAGETVREGAQLAPALDRAFASGVPYLLNVITDPSVAYPRSSSLV